MAVIMGGGPQRRTLLPDETPALCMRSLIMSCETKPTPWDQVAGGLLRVYCH